MGVVFRALPDWNEPGVDAWVVLDARRHTLADMSSCLRPCYIVLAEEDLVPLEVSPTIGFSTAPALTPPRRRRSSA